jgi:AcrR family transcriptional regulator
MNEGVVEPPPVTPRRASRSDALRSEAAILEAAADLFLERGYDGVSVDDVARAAGVTRQTVYNRFRDKRGLFAETIERHWTNWGRGPRVEEVSPADPVETQLRAVARAIVAFTDERQLALQKLIIAEARRDPALGEAAFKAGKGAHMSRFIAHLTWLHGEGRLCCPRPDIAAGQFVGLVQEFCVWPKVMGLTDSLGLMPPADTVIDEAIATFMARYGPGNAPLRGGAGAPEA